MRAWIAAVGLLVVGCGSDKDKPGAVGADGVRLVRDFKKAGSWSFDYKQDMTMTGGAGEMENAAKATGTIRIESKRDRTAKLTVDAELTVSGDMTGTQKMPAMEMVLDESDANAHIDDPERALTILLLPLPSKPLRIGETDTQAFSMPASIGNKKKQLDAPLTVTLTGIDTVNGRRCATVTTKLRLDYAAPEGTTKMHIDGTACIDLTDGLVVTSKMKLAMGVTSTEDKDLGMDMSGTLELARK